MSDVQATVPTGASRPPCKCERIGGGDPNKRIRCEWNETEQKYNRNCREVDVSECTGCA
jgi:hypothetical protein